MVKRYSWSNFDLIIPMIDILGPISMLIILPLLKIYTFRYCKGQSRSPCFHSPWLIHLHLCFQEILWVLEELHPSTCYSHYYLDDTRCNFRLTHFIVDYVDGTDRPFIYWMRQGNGLRLWGLFDKYLVFVYVAVWDVDFGKHLMTVLLSDNRVQMLHSPCERTVKQSGMCL